MNKPLVSKNPTKPSRPFKIGDLVDVMDRTHMRMSTVEVIRAGKRVVETECGRQWTQDGWWISNKEVWPFPWIKHSHNKTKTSPVPDCYQSK